MNLLTSLALGLGLTACSGKGAAGDSGGADTDGTPAADSGSTDGGSTDGGSTDGGSTGSTDGGTTAPPCEVTLDDANPEDGDSFFYRDPIQLEFDGAAADYAAITLVETEGGAEVPWDEAATVWDNLDTEVTLYPASPLAASTAYTLTVEVCQESTVISFTTDGYGAPITDGVASLVDRTYVVELSEVDYTEPAGLGFVLAGTLTSPILVGVQRVYKSTIDLLGAEGVLHNEGYYYQNTRLDTWDFSGADWADPFFSIDADEISISYDGVDIPIYDFHLEGTFAPDGGSIAGGKLWGLGDTRNMAGFISSTDPYAICDLLELSGVYCDACPGDGEPYCLFLKAEDIYGFEEPGLVLEPVVSEDDTGG